MLKKIKIYQFFIFAILLSPFLGYFSRSGIVAYGPLILLLLMVFLIELTYPKPMKLRDWIAVFLWLLYSLWASYYYIQNPFQGKYLTTHFLAIISLPFIVTSFIRIKNDLDVSNYVNFIYKMILFFLIGEFIICCGQITTYLFGIGFPVSEMHSEGFLISGTFNNSNDLATIVLLLSFIFSGIEKNIVGKRLLIWLLIAVLLVITGSRSALIVALLVFIITRGLSLKNNIISLAFLGGTYFVINILLDQSNSEVFGRFSDRIESINNVFQNGLDSDNSVNLRLDSYIHFFRNIGDLGLGSGEINNYFKYADGASFPTFLLFQNPHSLVIEIAYWLGTPGIVFFLLALFCLFNYSNNSILLLFVITVSSLIPSSTLGSLIYFLFIITTFFSYPVIKESSHIFLKNKNVQ